MPKARTKSPYDVHPGVAMIAKWRDDLPVKTGRSLEEWGRVLQSRSFPNRTEHVAWMMAEYGLGRMTVEQVYEFCFGQQTWEGDAEGYLKNAAVYVDEMFTKGKEWQRPVFEEIAGFVRSLGPDVKVCPCKTQVPFYRDRVFAEVKAATKARFELLLALDETPFAPPLVPNPRAKGNDRLRHMIPLASPKDFNATAKKWLTKAYRMDAKK